MFDSIVPLFKRRIMSRLAMARAWKIHGEEESVDYVIHSTGAVMLAKYVGLPISLDLRGLGLVAEVLSEAYRYGNCPMPSWGSF